MRSENLDVFFSDFGAEVIWGASKFFGILDMPDEMLADGMVISTEYILLVKASDIVGLNDGATLTVDGTNYKVRHIRRTGDGKISAVTLGKI